MKQNDINKMNKEVENIETALEELKSSFEEEISLDDVSSMNETVDELNEKYKNLQGSDVSETLTNISEFLDKFDGIETMDEDTLDELKEKLEFKDVNKNISKLEKSVEKIKSMLEKESKSEEDDNGDGDKSGDDDEK